MLILPYYSRKDNHIYTFKQQPQDIPFYTASIIKVAVLAQILHLEQENQLLETATDNALEESMIEHSNNGATTYLLTKKLNGDGSIEPLFQTLNMKNSSPDVTAWGTSITSATDQITLLNEIFFFNIFLSMKNANYVKDLMDHIESDQRWGISAADESAQLKNGWLSLNGAGWIVNSIGHITISDEDYTLAILTNNNSSQQEGQQLIEQLATDAKNVISNQ